MGVKENSSNVAQLNKAIAEIEKLNASEDQVLGIPMKHIKPKDQSQNLTLGPQYGRTQWMPDRMIVRRCW